MPKPLPSGNSTRYCPDYADHAHGGRNDELYRMIRSGSEDEHRALGQVPYVRANRRADRRADRQADLTPYSERTYQIWHNDAHSGTFRCGSGACAWRGSNVGIPTDASMGASQMEHATPKLRRSNLFERLYFVRGDATANGHAGPSELKRYKWRQFHV